jgi:ribonuclease HI
MAFKKPESEMTEGSRKTAGHRAPIYLFTDGAASGNPGPGGWGAILVCGNLRKEMSGGFRYTTNNRMELMAVIKGLEAIHWQNAAVEIWSDSTYVVKALNEGWLEKWQAKGFAKVKNVDLWLRFIEVWKRHRVTFHWLKGHAGHPENEKCDRMAVDAGAGAAARGEVLPADEGFENSRN